MVVLQSQQANTNLACCKCRIDKLLGPESLIQSKAETLTSAMNLSIIMSLIVAVEFYLAAPALSDYTIVLKNGRRMTVQSYREEGTTIKVPALGGEVGIPKEQIEKISNVPQPTDQGLNISDLTTSNHEAQAVQKTAPIESTKSKNGTVGADATTAANEQEAKEYQKRLAEVSQKLEMAKENITKLRRAAEPLLM